MITRIDDLYKRIEQQEQKKRLVLAVADDHNALDAVYKAAENGIIEGILVGNAISIKNLADKYNYNLGNFTIFDEKNPEKAVEKAVRMVHDAQADVLMKGNISTGILLKAVLNKDWGLRKGALLSHFALFEIENYHKLLGVTDAAMNIAPDLNAKIGILNNAVSYMNSIGIKNPKVAPICAVEVLNESMPATYDAALLTQMNNRGQIKNCIVDGPLAFDNAISSESAQHKGIISNVAGDADLLLFSNIEAGNVIYKALTYFAKAKLAAVILGASAPIVLTSRSDSEASKLNSIVLAAVSN